MRIIYYTKSNVKALLALVRAVKIKVMCNHFGSFSDHDNILYANGISIVGYRNVSIGERVSFGGNVKIFAYDRVEIGDDCMFAYGVIINTATHDYHQSIMNSTYINKPIKIGTNVWCGINSIILAGVIIGDGSVIGAGVVVTRDVPPNSIVTGAPTYIIKRRL